MDSIFVSRAAITKYHRLDDLNNRSGVWKSQIKIWNELKRILLEPENSLIQQYQALLAADGVEASFTEDGVEALAEIADRVNANTENIGARRLHTILEKVLEDLLYDAPEVKESNVAIDRAYIEDKLADIVQDEDMSRFIL